ncbi:hypothetical protein P689_119212 [Candidatus Riesia pediculischaeffi PTSU]|uniref:Uncharacterized protein n=1 Tax=Candidatus Riesia pediculischaeffi PTSU TaxID=1401651 RepID=A0A0C1SAE5_9ENTR|nr:hypothetical protein P689_119212 [Candidatus Riesia pediculischaeffi PTSU]
MNAPISHIEVKIFLYEIHVLDIQMSFIKIMLVIIERTAVKNY